MRVEVGFRDYAFEQVMHILRGAIRIFWESYLKSPPRGNESAWASPPDFARDIHHVTAKLKERVLGTYYQAEPGFELSGDGVKRPGGVDGEDGGIAEPLDWGKVWGLRRRERDDRYECAGDPD